jgi:hypothetical protein
MMSVVLCQVVELLVVVMDTITPLLQVQKLLLLAVHETHWSVMPAEHYTEIATQNLVIVLESGGVCGPPSSHRPSKVLGSIHSLLTLCEVEQPKL